MLRDIIVQKNEETPEPWAIEHTLNAQKLLKQYSMLGNI